MNAINNAEFYYNKGIKYRNKKKFNKSRAYFVNARNSISRHSLYSAYKDKYSIALYGNKKNRSGSEEKRTSPKWDKKVVETAIPVRISPVTKPFILSLSNDEKLENSIIESLNPDTNSLKIIQDSINNYREVTWVRQKVYNPKKKKFRSTHKKVYNKFEHILS